MINIIPNGSLNVTSFQAPGVYVLETLPQPSAPVVPTDRILFVGTASWGAKNSPTYIGNLNEGVANFGTPQNSSYDLMTHVYAATSMGNNDMVCVRVTDGTDLAATDDIVDVSAPTPVTGMTVTAKYTGTVGNSIKVTVGAGTNSTISAPTFKITVFFPIGVGGNNGVPEIFDNIGGTGAALWQNMVNAINLGQGSQVPPSNIIVATIGTATAAPAIATYALAGGTDGNSGVTDNTLVGVDTVPRTGMYAARNTGADYLVLCGATNSSTYQAQADFGVYEACYAILARPSGEAYTAAITAKKAIGLDTPWAKLLVGDWVRIQDNFNNVQRYITNQPFAAAILANIGSQESGLNKLIQSAIFLGTQTSDANKTYSKSDITQILVNGLDVVAKPSPGGFYFSLQTGKNTSSNNLANGDEFTKNTDFIAVSLGETAAPYIGTLATPDEAASLRNVMSSFLRNLQNQGIIGSSTGGQAYSVVIDNSQIAQGIQIVNVQVAFFRVIVVILVNLQTGLVSVNTVTNQ